MNKQDKSTLKRNLGDLEAEIKMAAYHGQLDFLLFEKRIRPLLVAVKECARGL